MRGFLKKILPIVFALVSVTTFATDYYFDEVDGNDIFAVYAVTKEAIDRARKGDGPTLI